MNYIVLEILRSVPMNTNVVFIFVVYCSFGRSVSRRHLALLMEMCEWISSLIEFIPIC